MRSLHCLLASAALVLVTSAVSPPTAEAAITLSQRGCQTYASWSGNIVWARNLGADKEKTRAELHMLDKKTPANIFELMLRNLDTLWTTSADWETVTLAILQDCINRRGTYEDGA